MKKNILLLTGIMFSTNVFAEVTDACIDAVHDHYQYILLVQPNLKTVAQKSQPDITAKGDRVILRIKSDCPPEITNKVLKKTEKYNISQSEFLKNLKQDTHIDISLVGDIIPLNRANKDDNEIMLWAANVLLNTYQITGKTFEGFDKLKRYYTVSAFEKTTGDILNSYLSNYIVKKNNNITISDSELLIKSSVAALPNITFQGINSEKKYTWRVSVPLLIEMKVSNRIKKEKLNILVHLVRVDNDISPDGILISNFEIGN